MQDLISEKNNKYIALNQKLSDQKVILNIIKQNFKFMSSLTKEYIKIDVGNGYSEGLYSE